MCQTTQKPKFCLLFCMQVVSTDLWRRRSLQAPDDSAAGVSRLRNQSSRSSETFLIKWQHVELRDENVLDTVTFTPGQMLDVITSLTRLPARWKTKRSLKWSRVWKFDRRRTNGHFNATRTSSWIRQIIFRMLVLNQESCFGLGLSSHLCLEHKGSSGLSGASLLLRAVL